MHISWLGYNAFRLQSEGITVITNPVEAAASFKINRQGGDIVVSSEPLTEAANPVSGNPFLITEPGEYEVKSVFVYGVPDGDKSMYLIRMEGINVVFLGSVKVNELTENQLATLEGADILIVPVGGGAVCTAADAAKIINQLEPRLVVPSYYKIPGSKGLDDLAAFMKEYSAPHEEVEKLKVQKKDLLNEDTKVVVIKP